MMKIITDYKLSDQHIKQQTVKHFMLEAKPEVLVELIVKIIFWVLNPELDKVNLNQWDPMLIEKCK